MTVFGRTQLPEELLLAAALEYTGGYTTKRGNGYIREYNPLHPRADCRGLVAQHRLVMERHLGRTLSPKEIVHHIDGNKQNNHIENLYLFASQAEHMSHEQRTSRKAACYDPNVVERVRRLAEDPTVSMKSLDLSNNTIVKICKMYSIEWKHGLELTEDQVKQALQGRSTHVAAELLGCHPQTLYNRFDHLLSKRQSPGFLEAVIEDVLQTAIEWGMNEAARRYGTSRTTVNKALKKAGLWNDYQAATASIRGGHRKNKQTPQPASSSGAGICR